MNDLRNFKEIFRKDVPYDDIKSHTKPGLFLTQLPPSPLSFPSAVLGLNDVLYVLYNGPCTYITSFLGFGQEKLDW